MCTSLLRRSRHSLALCEKLVAALNTDKTHASKSVKRRLDRNDDLLTVCQDIIAHVDRDKDDEDDRDDTNDNDKGNWIGRLVDQPEGERNRKPREGRLRWGKQEILEAADITEEQYAFYMVSLLLSLQFGLLTLFHQKSAHRLCNRYFDITMGFNDNFRTYPAEYALIIEKVCHLSLVFISMC